MTTGREGSAAIPRRWNSGDCQASSLQLESYLHLVFVGLASATAESLALEDDCTADDVDDNVLYFIRLPKRIGSFNLHLTLSATIGQRHDPNEVHADADLSHSLFGMSRRSSEAKAASAATTDDAIGPH